MGKTFKIVGGDISDGYHTFAELYEHRSLLFINLCLSAPERAVAGATDGEYFVLFFEGLAGQISYHVHTKYFPLIAGMIRTDSTYKWDGHDSDTVAARLLRSAQKWRGV